MLEIIGCLFVFRVEWCVVGDMWLIGMRMTG